MRPEPAAVRMSTDPVRAILWMTLCTLSFAGTLVATRVLLETYPPAEIMLFRAVVGVVLLAPLVRLGASRAALRRSPGGYLAAGGFTGLGVITFYWAVASVPLADATALNFNIPIFTMLFAAIWLGERVDAARIAALVGGFAGVLIVLRPGAAAISLPAISAVASAAIFAFANIAMKRLGRDDRPEVIAFTMHVVMVPMAVVATLADWVTPRPADLGWVIAVGAFGALSYVGLTRAFALAEASAVIPIDFLRLVWASLVGMAFFGERPDIWTWVGAVVIFVSAYGAIRREARMRRESAPR